MKYRVYMIENGAGKRYIGLSADVLHRLAQHNAGESKWTRQRGAWSLTWTSDPMPLGDARRLENRLKR